MRRSADPLIECGEPLALETQTLAQLRLVEAERDRS
jgi:hypothetical protein